MSKYTLTLRPIITLLPCQFSAVLLVLVPPIFTNLGLSVFPSKKRS